MGRWQEAGEVGAGVPSLVSCLAACAAWARGETKIPRKETHVDPDSTQENSVPLWGPGCPHGVQGAPCLDSPNIF